jgi:hypothetical protein
MSITHSHVTCEKRFIIQNKQLEISLFQSNEKQIYHIVGTIHQSNIKVVERDKIDTL